MKKILLFLIISVWFVFSLCAQSNPMGKTWAVFIENTNYLTLSSLAGSIKDVQSVTGALANYQMDRILVERDMSLEKMKKFFSSGLVSLLRENNVSSLLIWYSGHGKFINETGYWIPVDAVRDDESTFYKMDDLKNELKKYAGQLSHILVVTDACESGPTFFQAMRSIPVEPDCAQAGQAKRNSYQVLSALGYDLASSESLFSRAFATALADNTRKCIPVQTIARKVTVAMIKNHQDRPQFGNIAGLKNEGGTFLFYKK